MGDLIIGTVGYFLAIIFAATGVMSFLQKQDSKVTGTAFILAITAAAITKILLKI